MNFDELTDENIVELLRLPKRVSNPAARWKEKPGHKQKNYIVKGGDHDFQVYLRQSLNDEDDFSCGLKLIKPDGQPLTLVRYNGASHIHGGIVFRCHIHRATEKAIKAGGKPERYAEETTQYHTLDGALFVLTEECAVSGLSGLKPDEPDMFRDQEPETK